MDIEILNQNFLKAADIVSNFKIRPHDNDLLKLYGLFKQANDGDNNSPEPYFTDLVSKRKWIAWRSHIGKTKEIAKQDYISLTMELFKKYN